MNRHSLLSGVLLLGIIAFLTIASLNASAEEIITYTTRQGDEIKAIYIPAPDTAMKPTPAIIMLHGCGGLYTSKGEIRSRERAWIDILHAEGYALLLPASFASRGYGYLCKTKNRPVTPEGQRPHDAMGAVQYLAGKPLINPNRIALLGWSNGAMTGLHTVRKGADAAPASDATDARTAVVFYPGCIALKRNYPDYEARIPTLIQHGKLDDWTLAKPCQEFVLNAIRSGRGAPMFIDLYSNAYHGFDNPNSKLRTITTKNSVYESGQKEVHVGTNPEARKKAIARTLEWFRIHLDTSN